MSLIHLIEVSIDFFWDRKVFSQQKSNSPFLLILILIWTELVWFGCISYRSTQTSWITTFHKIAKVYSSSYYVANQPWWKLQCTYTYFAMWYDIFHLACSNPDIFSHTPVDLCYSFSQKFQWVFIRFSFHLLCDTKLGNLLKKTISFTMSWVPKRSQRRPQGRH